MNEYIPIDLLLLKCYRTAIRAPNMKKEKYWQKNSLWFLRYFIKFHLFDGGGGGGSLSCNYVEFFGCSVFG